MIEEQEYEDQKITPGLFGLNHSNRDFTQRTSWGKNQFNNSFPASLACYMESQGLDLVYFTLDNELKVTHQKIKVAEVFGIISSSALSGKNTHKYMACSELVTPRITKSDIKNIILGGGQDFLSPERRFDAIILGNPEIFA